jgi:hypothetical protein
MPVALAACVIEVWIVDPPLRKPIHWPEMVDFEELFPTDNRLGSLTVGADEAKILSQKGPILVVLIKGGW